MNSAQIADREAPVASTGKLRLAVLQRVCPGYRVRLFSALSASEDIDFRLFIGADLPNSKVKSAECLTELRVTRLKTRFVRLGRRLFPWHIGLVGALREFKPDVILCEGESHFLGYLEAMYYRARYGSNTGLMHWCFISLPGEPAERRDAAARIKAYFRRHFDAFVVYSSFSRDRLIGLGEPEDKVFVATNVGDVGKFYGLSEALKETKASARRRLGLPDRFTVLYAGTLDENKCPDVILDLARASNADKYSFVLAGSGPQLEALRQRAASEGLSQVHLPGRVGDDLVLFYRAADVLLVPGRGGIVISEAMACGLPVIVHQADGTEYDLVEDGLNGYRVSSGDAWAFLPLLESLRSDPDLLLSMGAHSKELVRQRFNESNMVDKILRAARFAKTARTIRQQKRRQ